MTETKNAEVWHRIIKRHQTTRTKMIELNLKIEEAMQEYLKTINENGYFTLRFEDTGIVNLECEGDLFNLQQIGGFCDVFNLQLVINNRVIVENHLKDETRIRTKYLFTTQNIQKEESEGD